MLRIDETSKTLVAPEASAPVPEEAPARDELHALICGGWDAFAGEIDQPQLKAVGAAPEPGIDILAVDQDAGRAAVVIVADGPADEALTRGLAAAASVASWDADKLGALSESLQSVTEGDAPKIIIVGARFSAADHVTYGYLADRHRMDISAYGIEVTRHGSDRMMDIVSTFPVTAIAEPDFFTQVDPSDSTPPPPPVAPPAEIPAPPAA